MKLLTEVRSVKTGILTVHAPAVTDVATANFAIAPQTMRVVDNIEKAITIRENGVDISNINRLLRKPKEPTPELTAAKAASQTR